jgi:hypothetical protein
MTFPFPYGGITVTVERGTADRFNDVTYSDHHTISNCYDYPSGSDEASPNVGISDARSLLVPSGSDVQATDRIVLHAPGSATPPPVNSPERRAVTYQVIGRPKDWTHAMTGWHPGMSVDLQRIS